MEMSGQLRASATLPPGRDAGWTSLNNVMKRKFSTSRRKSNPNFPVVYPAAYSHYTDRGTPAVTSYNWQWNIATET
jgi:hypothetical protein